MTILPSDDTLGRVSLPSEDDDPGSGPMIAILDAKPGLTSQLRKTIVEVVLEVRRLPSPRHRRPLLPLQDLRQRRRD
jgi:hypothetical protein